ncbi:WAT1-related protein At5g64700-like isoform X1 [Miscanthus floridulus]|uniref:WAT1-related protein At5g64700-like isoform X1 n=1 Tax=Miscanthus floridulus TaxID=154761 RepID=UPI00345990B4
MDDAATKKAYIIAIVVQIILAGMSVISKAAFDAGLSTFIFVFYRQAAGSILMLPLALILQRKNARSMPFGWLLKLFLCALVGNTLSLSLYNVSLKFTSATVSAAAGNSMPVFTFCLALLLRMEVVKPRSASGIAKLSGVALCLAGVFVIAFYYGPALSPVNHHRAFTANASASAGSANNSSSNSRWIEGTFLMVLANVAWSLSIVWQAALLEEVPNRMLVATALCVFSAVQSFVVAVATERDLSRWRLHLDASLLSVVYAGFVVTGVTYYLQAWCVVIKGPVFFAVWTPLCFVLTIFSSSFFLGEIVRLGSVVGGILLVGGLYSVLWGKNKESKVAASSSEVNMTADCTLDVDDEEHKKPNKYGLEEATSSALAGEQV